MAPVTKNINHHIALKRLAKLQSEFRNKADGERIVAVHMENRRLNHLRHIGAILGGSSVRWKGGETDLIIHNQMNRPANPVALELRHVQRLGNNSLASKGGISMHNHRQNFPPLLRVLTNALLGAGHPHDHRVDRFQMARISGKPHQHFAPRFRLPGDHVTEVIFDITVASRGVRQIIFGKLREDQIEGLAEKLRDHAESTAVSHAHTNFLDATSGTIFENAIESGNQRFPAFERKPFLALIPRVEKVLEAFDLA